MEDEVFTVNWTVLLGVLAILTAVTGWLASWRKTAVAEGKHLEEVGALRKRIEDVEKEADYLRGCSDETKIAVKELSTDMKWVKDALSDIKALLQRKA